MQGTKALVWRVRRDESTDETWTGVRTISESIRRVRHLIEGAGEERTKGAIVWN